MIADYERFNYWVEKMEAAAAFLTANKMMPDVANTLHQGALTLHETTNIIRRMGDVDAPAE